MLCRFRRSNVATLLGNNYISNISFREELDDLANLNDHIRVEYVLSGANVVEGWKGKTGFVTKDVVTEVIPDCMTRVFYVSGPLKMVLSVESSFPTPEFQTNESREIISPVMTSQIASYLGKEALT